MNRLLALLPVIAACSGALDGIAPPGGMRSGQSASSEIRGINIDPQNPTANPTPETLASLGATRVRFTLRAGADLNAALAAWDPIIDGYRAAAIDVLVILDGETVPLPARPVELAASGRWDAYVATFAARAQTIAAHLGSRVTAIEVWNEEDLDDSLPGRHIDAAPYAQLLNAVHAAVHNVSGVPVLVGGLASGSTAYVDAMGNFAADGIATHPYLHWPGDDVPAGWFRLADHVTQYAHYGRPLWFTEWGTNDPALEARLITAFFAHPEITGQVSSAYFFGWSDTQDAGFGITTDGTTHKADAWAAFQGAAPPPVIGSVVDGSATPDGGSPPPPPPPPPPSDGQLHGTLTDASNGGVIHPLDPGHASGITVYCAGQSVVVAADGTYRFDHIAPGVYGITAVNNVGSTGWYAPFAGSVTMVSGDNLLDIALQPAGAPPPMGDGSVRGTLYDASNGGVIHPLDPAHMAGITVYCAGQEVTVAGDGTYAFARIAPGTYGISAVNNQGQTSWYQTWNGTVTVNPGATTSEDIHLSPN